MDVAQVEVRLGDTALELASIAAGERFWIGTAPGVDLAVAGIGVFPLVAGDERGTFTVRAPIGMVLAIGGLPVGASELRLAPGVVATLAVGLAVVEIRLVALPRASIPRPALDVVPAIYAAASLLAHLAVWGLALGHAAPPRPHHERPRLVAIGGRRAHAPDRPIAPTAVTPTSRAPHTAAPVASTAEPARSGAHAAPRRAHLAMTIPLDGSQAVGELVRTLDRIDLAGKLAQVGPLYRPEDAPSFGDQRMFDPETRRGFGTIPSGAYTTIAHGRGAGDDYFPRHDPLVALCATARCAIAGALTRDQLGAALAPIVDRLATCADVTGEIALELDIDATGKPGAILTTGSTDIAQCAAELVAGVAFPAADGPTHATYTIAYQK